MVTTCIIPCAGLGTRLRPLTRVVPKELLPYGDRPLIDHLWDEVWEAGIRRIIIVLRQGKELIQQHLSDRDAVYVYQERPGGLGDAIRAAQHLVDGPTLVALPDQHLKHASRQLLQGYQNQQTLFSQVHVENPEFFPGATAFETENNHVISLAGEQGNLRGFGRTIYAPEFFSTIPENSQDGDFFRIISHWLQQGTHQVVSLQGEPADLGIMAGYLYYNRRYHVRI
ncbi:MAG: NTP transferase domain-containing protein [Candidatus Eremiobacteraeota bacterium]|nr:NTP transferase domain-containing protein [Candidatus Eremiobacteraeota bacterium]MCW5871121.1 NTP transferase domain-containing protein [Candidatus Eremiobacteraeota bacterium]